IPQRMASPHARRGSRIAGNQGEEELTAEAERTKRKPNSILSVLGILCASVIQTAFKGKRPVRLSRQAKPAPARHLPDARSARPERWLFHCMRCLVVEGDHANREGRTALGRRGPLPALARWGHLSRGTGTWFTLGVGSKGVARNERGFPFAEAAVYAGR